MSKYNRGNRDDGGDCYNSRSKASFEEKDSYRKQDAQGPPKSLASDSDNRSSRSHHREDETRTSGGSQTRGGADSSNNKYGTGKQPVDADKRRSQSPDYRRNTSSHDDTHKGARNSTGRYNDANHQDRRSPERRRDKCRSRSRSRRSKSRSAERRRSRSRERERRRPRSRSRDRRKSRSKERKYRPNRSRDRIRHRSHSRSRSRTPEYCRPRHPVPVVSKPVVKAEDSKTEAEKKLVDLNNEKPSNLPLNDMSQLTRSGMMTPQMAVQQAMAAMNARAQQLTGVTLPKYYNPAAVNPLKYAEQMQKRKLLWQSTQKKEVPAPSTNNWECTTFAQDQDGKVAAKFKKLMGIKGEAEDKAPLSSEDQLRKQEELFRTLDHQYEAARMSTHSFRGVGLGFSSAAASVAPTTILFPK